MADETLRTLERALAEEPANGALRVQMARALARASRPRDALARLELATIDPVFFDEARALADSLWRDELSQLERRTVIPLGERPGPDPADSALVVTEDGLVGWRSDFQRGGAWGVCDIERGRLIAESEPAHIAMKLVASARAVFVDELRIASGSRHVLAISREGTTSVDTTTALLDLDPRGTRFAEGSAGLLRIREWPGLQVCHEMKGHDALIDWEEGVAFVKDRGRRVAQPFGGEPREIEWPFRERLARGVYADTGSALVLHAWPGLAPISLLAPATDPVPAPSLAADRRVLRIVLGGKPRRFEVDLERGVCVRAPADKEKLARVNAETGRWHPHADAVFRYRKDRLMELVTPEERLLILPPGTWPRAWTPDGHSLIAVSSSQGERRLEVWSGKS